MTNNQEMNKKETNTEDRFIYDPLYAWCITNMPKVKDDGDTRSLFTDAYGFIIDKVFQLLYYDKKLSYTEYIDILNKSVIIEQTGCDTSARIPVCCNVVMLYKGYTFIITAEPDRLLSNKEATYTLTYYDSNLNKVTMLHDRSSVLYHIAISKEVIDRVCPNTINNNTIVLKHSNDVFRFINENDGILINRIIKVGTGYYGVCFGYMNNSSSIDAWVVKNTKAVISGGM